MYVIESEGSIAKTIVSHCDNKGCYNFTTNGDLSGSWCSSNCFVEHETGCRDFVICSECEAQYDGVTDIPKHHLEYHEKLYSLKQKIIMFADKSDSQLEDMWQACSMTISMALMQYYKDGDETKRKVAQEAQDRQSKIQEEITRRH